MPHTPENHFEGKTVPEHLKDARIKGAKAAAESHGTEMSGKQSAFADTLKDTSLTLALLSLLLFPSLGEKKSIVALLLFFGGWIIWKTARSAAFGWARLERLHRIAEEEKWEIEHHREQEREELFELYRAKGFDGELLSQVVDVLMGDENKLLEIMLEEELGISLEAHEHPLEQASGALFGGLVSGAVASLGYVLFSFHGLTGALFLLFLAGGIFTSKTERIGVVSPLVWNAAIFLMSCGILYFIVEMTGS